MKQRIRVLTISNMYPNDNNIAFGIFVKSHIDGFRKYTDVVQLIVANSDNRKGFFRLLNKYSKLIIKSLYYSFFKKFDIIHAHFAFPTGFIALMSNIFKKKKFVISVHGGDINDIARRNKINFNLCKLSLRKADYIIANSNSIKDILVRDFYINKNKIQVINIDLFKPLNKKICRNKLGLDIDEKIILFVGNLIEAKGIIHLIEALKHVKNYYKRKKVKCILIGNSSDYDFLNFLNIKISLLKLNKEVKIIGLVPHNIIPDWMNSADVFILPSLTEGFGLVALESIACGIPTITTNVGGLKEIIKDERTGYVVKHSDEKSLAEKIIFVLNKKDESFTYIKKEGLKFAKLNSTYNQIKKIEKLYNRLIKYF